MSVKITALECPVCGGAIEVTPGSKISYCPYCGSKLLIVDDSEQTININKNININKTYLDKTQAEKAKIQKEIESNKEDTKAIFAGVLVLALVCGLCAIIFIFG